VFDVRVADHLALLGLDGDDSPPSGDERRGLAIVGRLTDEPGFGPLLVTGLAALVLDDDERPVDPQDLHSLPVSWSSQANRA